MSNTNNSNTGTILNDTSKVSTIKKRRQQKRTNPVTVKSKNSKSSKPISSVLRYNGGKQRAINILDKFIPDNVKEICSPFTGGSSFELHCAQQRGIKVYAYDIFEPLINFWQCLKQDAKQLVEQVKTLHPLSKDAFYHLRDHKVVFQNPGDNTNSINHDPTFIVTIDNLIESTTSRFSRAAAYFAVNRASFSGAGMSGGYSAEAAEKRFTVNSIDKLKDIDLTNITFECMDFAEAIAKHPTAHLFLDPPYLLEKGKNNLYGNRGDCHKNFDHIRLFNILKTRSNCLLCYNNCDYIRKLYTLPNAKIHDVKWSYGMSKDKNSKELVIVL